MKKSRRKKLTIYMVMNNYKPSTVSLKRPPLGQCGLNRVGLNSEAQ